MKFAVAVAALWALGLGMAHAKPPEPASEETLIDKAADAFLNLCVAGVDGAGFETALDRAVVSGRAQWEGEDGPFTVRSHDAWSLTRPVTWEGEHFDLAWGDDARLCGLIDIPAINDVVAFNAAITERLQTAGQEQNGILMPGIGSGAATHTVWTVNLAGGAYEVVSVQLGDGPQHYSASRDGVLKGVILDHRRQTLWLRRPTEPRS